MQILAPVLASLPMVAAGLIRFEIVPLRAYPGFTRLFSPETLRASEPA
jgi:hypothetical protein